MPDLAAAFAASLLLGMRHATDPDHLVAVTTIVARERALERAAAVGALWGLGHSATLLAVGGAVIVLGLAFPPRLGLALEFAVALMLVALGLANVFGGRRRAGPRAARWTAARPVAVGVVHGLAGSAAAALLVLPFIADARWAVAYLAVFGAGTVAGMALATSLVAAPAAFAAGRAGRFARWERALRLASGAASVAFGLYLAHAAGVEDGLFGASPRWTPR